MTGWATVLIGCGKIGAGYATDPVMAEHYKYVSHAQVLAAHPAFDWRAAVDVDVVAAHAVATRWAVQQVATDASALPDPAAFKVAVLAIPPGDRLLALSRLPNLRAVIVEKPMGADAAEAEKFLQTCQSRNIEVQVNLPRRADTVHRALASGDMVRQIGKPQGAFIVYGNGLANNGTHMIDLARWYLGEVDAVQVAAGAAAYREGPLAGDVNVPFALRHRSGTTTLAQSIGFAHYRENLIEIWGETGRLSLAQEGLRLAVAPVRPNRAMQGEREVSGDAAVWTTTSMGESLYLLYEDLAAFLRGERDLIASPGRNAARNAVIVDAIRASIVDGGRRVKV